MGWLRLDLLANRGQLLRVKAVNLDRSAVKEFGCAHQWCYRAACRVIVVFLEFREAGLGETVDDDAGAFAGFSVHTMAFRGHSLCDTCTEAFGVLVQGPLRLAVAACEYICDLAKELSGNAAKRTTTKGSAQTSGHHRRSRTRLDVGGEGGSDQGDGGVGIHF